ncbi:MAG: hypothetical protein K1X74_06225 [Pirellulales bacterium]|nr:hypothetical protein [Pirellulales bacterium]
MSDADQSSSAIPWELRSPSRGSAALDLTEFDFGIVALWFQLDGPAELVVEPHGHSQIPQAALRAFAAKLRQAYAAHQGTLAGVRPCWVFAHLATTFDGSFDFSGQHQPATVAHLVSQFHWQPDAATHVLRPARYEFFATFATDAERASLQSLLDESTSQHPGRAPQSATATTDVDLAQSSLGVSEAWRLIEQLKDMVPGLMQADAVPASHKSSLQSALAELYRSSFDAPAANTPGMNTAKELQPLIELPSASFFTTFETATREISSAAKVAIFQEWLVRQAGTDLGSFEANRTLATQIQELAKKLGQRFRCPARRRSASPGPLASACGVAAHLRFARYGRYKDGAFAFAHSQGGTEKTHGHGRKLPRLVLMPASENTRVD